VHAQIEIAATTGDGGDLLERGTRDHDASAGGGGFHGANAAFVCSDRHTQVVDVDDDRAIIRFET